MKIKPCKNPKHGYSDSRDAYWEINGKRIPCPFCRIAELEKALEFYANRDNWETYPPSRWSAVSVDYGSNARNALGVKT